MSYSSLAKTYIMSPNCTKPRNQSIDSVAIHTMAANLTVESCGNWFQNPMAEASSNYGIDSAGNIAVYVEEENRSWCTSNRNVDHRAVTIEVASTTTDEPYACTPQAYEALITLLVDICQRNNIYELKWKNDMHYAISAANGGPVREQNMFVHRWFDLEKSCPGNWLFMRMGQIANEVNQRLKGEKQASMNLASTSYITSYAGYYAGTDTSRPISYANVDYQEYNPYLVTLARNSIVDYSKLRQAKVIGAVVEAGYYYENNRLTAKHFENPNLKSQVEALEEIEMPYGFYTYARARFVKEVDAEMYQFSFPVRRYPPQLGVWLNLSLGKNQEINDKIMERYAYQLKRLGYAGKMGVIATALQLSYIDWDKWKDEFLLWYDGHVSSLDELDKLLDPTFFDMEEKIDFYKSGKSVIQ